MEWIDLLFEQTPGGYLAVVIITVMFLYGDTARRLLWKQNGVTIQGKWLGMAALLYMVSYIPFGVGYAVLIQYNLYQEFQRSFFRFAMIWHILIVLIIDFFSWRVTAYTIEQ